MSKSVELAKLTPTELEATVPVDDYASLVIANGLAAPIFIRWGVAENDPPDPTFFDWDWAVPGESLMIVPVPAGERRAKMLVIYPGAPPVTDVAAVVHGSACAWAPQVGPLA